MTKFLGEKNMERGGSNNRIHFHRNTETKKKLPQFNISQSKRTQHKSDKGETVREFTFIF